MIQEVSLHFLLMCFGVLNFMVGAILQEKEKNVCFLFYTIGIISGICSLIY